MRTARGLMEKTYSTQKLEIHRFTHLCKILVKNCIAFLIITHSNIIFWVREWVSQP